MWVWGYKERAPDGEFGVGGRAKLNSFAHLTVNFAFDVARVSH